MAILTSALLAAFSMSASAQGNELFAGDSIRIDGETVGTVLSITGRTMTMVSRAAPRCRAGQMHGEPPVCDPAPLIRRQMDLGDVSIERRMQKGNVNLRTIIGGVLGAAAFGAAGYAVGPSVGFGKIGGCQEVSESRLCSDGLFNDLTPAEAAVEQKRQDQRRGALFFGALGGTFTAIMARKLAVGWVRIEPSIPAGPTEPWGLTLRLPSTR